MEFCKSLHISKLETNSTMLRSCGKIYEEIYVQNLMRSDNQNSDNVLYIN